MAGSWDEMRRAKEEQFFEEQNKQAMARLKSRGTTTPRLSPVSGKPMEQRTLMGVVIDVCPDSGGVWLDHGELELLMKATEENAKSKEPQSEGLVGRFFDSLYKKK